MAIQVGYVFREVGYGVRRNVTLFLATVITVTISLAQFGGGLLISDAVTSATERWRDGIEFIVYMNSEATPEQLRQVESLLNPEVNQEIKGYEFVDKQQAYQEFEELFADTPSMIENVSPEVMPPSYRVLPVDTDTEVVESVAGQFRNQPGVLRVTLASDVIRELERTSDQIQGWLIVASILLLIASVLLVFNTIRTVIFARRREIEVMKLVGASNGYIRMPFMIEGTLQGLLGALLAVPMLYFLRNQISTLGGDPGDENVLTLLQGFDVDDAQLFSTSLIVLGLGAALGAIASVIAISRFLDV